MSFVVSWEDKSFGWELWTIWAKPGEAIQTVAANMQVSAPSWRLCKPVRNWVWDRNRGIPADTGGELL